MKNLRKSLMITGLVIVMSSFGLVGGTALNATISSNVVYASCEQDECEGGTTCVDNAGHNTSCGMTGEGCATDGCSGGGNDGFPWPWKN